MRLTPIERFASFAKTAGEAVVDERELEDAFEGFEDGHLGAAARWGVCRHAGLFRLGDGRGGLFSVRLGCVSRCSETWAWGEGSAKAKAVGVRGNKGMDGVPF